MDGEETMKTCKPFVFSHCFNHDKKKKGPLLQITVVPTKDGADFYSEWIGNGRATKDEMLELVKHYRSTDFVEVAEYIMLAYVG